MSGMRRVLRWTRRLLVGLVAFVLLLAGGLATLAWYVIPDLDGAAEIPGLENPVAIAFDANAVPTIRARSETDAAAALGYLHARERMAQMDGMRRAATGRLSELVGSSGLRADRFTRALDLRRRAETDLEGLPPETRAMLAAYARGVNARINEMGRFISLEAALLGPPEPWSEVDSILWGKVMGLLLSGNFRTEIARAALAKRLPRERIEELWPRDASPGTPYAGPLPPADHLRRIVEAFPEVGVDSPLPRHASNAWTVAGRLSATGAPLLASDPHLLMTFPVTWYLARIELPDRTISGATGPGAPFVLLGQNGDAAWGFTTTHADTQDVFIERITPGRPDHYDTPDGPKPFTVREELIRVRFGEDVRLSIRETRHGPVISDLDPQVAEANAEGYVLAVRMAQFALPDTGATGIHRMTQARSVAEVGEALKLLTSPMQNVMVADRAGAIAMFVPGRVPLRRAGEGAWPVPGWDDSHAWDGFAPWESLPHQINPPSGMLANANNRIVPPDFQPLISRDWFGDSRFRRIITNLRAHNPHTVEGLASVQVDAVSLPAREHNAAMRAGLAPSDPRAQTALGLLAAWDGTMAADRPEPLIWAAWSQRFLSRVLREAGINPGEWRESSFEFLGFVLTRGAHWCGGDCTAWREATLIEALAHLATPQGDDPRTWQWGRAHVVHPQHPVLRFIPGVNRLASTPHPLSGDATTVLRAAARGFGDNPFEAVHGAGYRAVYDLADPTRSRFALAGGQSGHAFARHSADLLGGWARGETFALLPPPAGAPLLVLTPDR
jgi:penicillin amidase